MNRKANIAKYRYPIIAIIGIALIISFFYANLYHKITPYHPINILQVKVLDDANKSSYGNNVRIESIKKADGSYVDVESIAAESDWEYGVDKNILGYYKQGNSEISIPVNTDAIVLSMIKQNGSGIIEVSIDGNYYKTIDLFCPEWISTTEIVHGRLNISGAIFAFVVSFIIVTSTLLSLFHHIRIKKNITVKDLVPGIAVAVSLAGLICIYAPLELYFTNINDFWYDFSLVLPAMINLFLVCMFLLFEFLGIILCINPKLYKAGVLICFTLLVVIYIQGNFLAGQLPPMDGTAIDWGNFTVNNIITIVICLFAGSVIGIAAWKVSIEKVCRAVSFISGGLFLMLMCTISVLCVTNNGLAVKHNMKATDNNEFLMSTNQNFIIFVLDAIDSRTFWKVLEDHPEYKEIFNDFTYYPDTLGAYSFTSRSIPYILSGKWFENKEPFEQYQTDALRNSPLFENLEERHYSLGIYDQDLNMNLGVGLERFDNQVEIEQQVTSWKDFLLTYLSMGGVKYAPYNIKQYCYEIIGQREHLLLNTENIGGNKNFRWQNTDFYRSLTEKGFELTDNKIFKFIHLEGAHLPYQYNVNLEITADATYETNIEASITLMKTYLDSLKKSGLYDNSTIIFMADHGYWEDIYNPDEILELRQNPILLMKGFNEAHDFHLSKMPISYEDLQKAYVSLLDGKQGEDVFDIKEGEARERRYLHYIYLEENMMEEYIQTGDVWQPELIHSTGRKFNQ